MHMHLIMIKYTYLDPANLRGHRRYFLPALSPYQAVIADDNVICWGTSLNFLAFFAPQAQRSTAQHNPSFNPHKQQSQYAPISARQRKQADSVGSSQHVVEHLYSSIVFSKQTKKSKSARPTKRHNHCNHSQSGLRSLLTGILFSFSFLPKFAETANQMRRVLCIMFHEIETLVQPNESTKPAARAQGIRLIVLLEVPQLLEGRQYLASVAINSLWREVFHKKIAGDFVLISPISVSRVCRLDEASSRDAQRFLRPAMAWERRWG